MKIRNTLICTLLISSLVSCIKYETIPSNTKETNTTTKSAIHEELIGNWNGVRIELISKTKGNILTEEEIKLSLNKSMSAEEISEYIEGMQTQYTYTYKADNSISIKLKLQNNKTRELDGTLSLREGDSDSFIAKFDTSSLKGADMLKIQEVEFDGREIKITTHFGNEYYLVTYYAITK